MLSSSYRLRCSSSSIYILELMVYFSSWFFSGCLSLSGEIDAELVLGLAGDSLVKLELVKLLSSSKSCTFINVLSTSVPNLFASYGL
jgi:hypothetical protein